jgi:hypothetical protein
LKGEDIGSQTAKAGQPKGKVKYVSRKVTSPIFSGAHKDFQVRWTRFLAFASVYQFMQAIADQPEADPPSLYPAIQQSIQQLMKESVRKDATTETMWQWPT